MDDLDALSYSSASVSSEMSENFEQECVLPEMEGPLQMESEIPLQGTFITFVIISICILIAIMILINSRLL